MPAASARYRPCSERSRRPSSLRVNTARRAFSSTATWMDGSIAWLRLALPASTLRTPWAKETFVPSFHVTGCFPTRLMALRSPHRGQALAAHAARAALAVGEHAHRRAVDGDARAVEHAPHVGHARVEAAAGLAVATDLVDELLAVGPVLELDAELRLALAGHHGPVRDEALALEHLGDVALHAGGRHGHLVAAHVQGVAHAGQHVGDGVGHGHGRVLAS